MFLFNHKKELISVPGAAGRIGNNLCNGSLTTELEHSDKFKYDEKYNIGYGKNVFDLNLFFF